MASTNRPLLPGYSNTREESSRTSMTDETPSQSKPHQNPDSFNTSPPSIDSLLRSLTIAADAISPAAQSSSNGAPEGSSMHVDSRSSQVSEEGSIHVKAQQSSPHRGSQVVLRMTPRLYREFMRTFPHQHVVVTDIMGPMPERCEWLENQLLGEARRNEQGSGGSSH